jgi:molybdate-binding protein/DNA-binding transcriptional regulator YhcF (GntR family)
MEEQHLYQKIVVSIRQDVLTGRLHPGDRLPSVRQAAAEWSCTIGTVQRAYAELARQGLVVSRSGQGTHVVDKPPAQDETPLRRAMLVHRAEAFLLETLTAGYTPAEVENALRLALDQWRAISTSPEPGEAGVLRFAGSHDLALTWLAGHFPAANETGVVPRFTLQLGFTGSLGGLIALQQGRADLAGCHLWDEATDSYNVPYVRRLLPGVRVALLTLAYRRLGLILPSVNPLGVADLADLERPGLRFANRQPGSGTRVWLDAALRRLGIDTTQIRGYDFARLTHSDVARAVAEGDADAGFGLETAALAFGLSFIPLVTEPYDLVIPAEKFSSSGIQRLYGWLSSPQARKSLAELGGYDTSRTGELIWVE